jgi:hypothetical protein
MKGRKPMMLLTSVIALLASIGVVYEIAHFALISYLFIPIFLCIAVYFGYTWLLWAMPKHLIVKKNSLNATLLYRSRGPVTFKDLMSAHEKELIDIKSDNTGLRFFSDDNLNYFVDVKGIKNIKTICLDQEDL